MEAEVLDTERVQKLRSNKGLTDGMWIIRRLGMKRTAGYALLRDGRLPKDPKVRRKVLKDLGDLLDADERQLVVRLVAKRAV